MSTRLVTLAATLLLGTAPVVAQTALPYPPPRFEGTIGQTYKDSKSAWPRIPTARKGAPNVLVILLDDVGFGQTSTFGA